MQIFVTEETVSACDCYERTAKYCKVIDEVNPPCQWTALTVSIDQNCLHTYVCVFVCACVRGDVCCTACKGKQLALV